MYIAHKREQDNKIQTVKEHSNQTAEICEKCSIKELKNIAYNIGLLHDVGKYQKSFQERINGKNIRVEHSMCGALVAEKKYSRILRLLFQYCIAGHHSGIPNGGLKIDTEDMSTLSGRLKRQFEDYNEYEKELVLKEIDENNFNEYIKKDCNKVEDVIEKYAFLVRYLFSCLTDADTIDTADFCNAIKYKNLDSNFEKCLEKVNKKFDEFKTVTELQKARSQIQKQVYENIKSNSKIFLMNMPTGSGKTLCSVKFALERAIKTNKKRIIYIIPYNSIIDQTVSEFESIFGEDAQILRHQSTFSIDEKKDINEDYKNILKLSMENWNADFIVTTSVQFFESIYSNKRGKLRKLHNMQDSILIFDEAHLMPKDYLQPCLRGIYYITKLLNSEAIFLTATMPNFKELMKKYVSDNIEISDLVTDKRLFSKFEKCKYYFIGEQSYKELLLKTNNNPSNLIIVNSRATARKLYSLCAGKKYHLSTYMTAYDREIVINKIKNDLLQLEIDYPNLINVPDHRRITVISTSLIEAGVDLDFHSVYRELSGLDNILQSGGRCNREGKRKNAKVEIFELSEEKYKVKHDDGRSNICFNLIKKYDNISDEKIINEYYNQLFFIQHENIIKNSISNECKDISSIPFEEYSNKFELIDSKTISIIVPRDELSKKLIEEIKYTHIANTKKLQRYSSTVYRYEFDDLLKQNVLDDYGSGVFCLKNIDYYDSEIGLKFEGKDYII